MFIIKFTNDAGGETLDTYCGKSIFGLFRTSIIDYAHSFNSHSQAKEIAERLICNKNTSIAILKDYDFIYNRDIVRKNFFKNYKILEYGN